MAQIKIADAEAASTQAHAAQKAAEDKTAAAKQALATAVAEESTADAAQKAADATFVAVLGQVPGYLGADGQVRQLGKDGSIVAFTPATPDTVVTIPDPQPTPVPTPVPNP